MGIVEDTGGGCSICGDTPAKNIQGTYWLCEPCEQEREQDELVCEDPGHYWNKDEKWKCQTCGL